MIFRIIQEALSNIVAKLDVVRKQVFIEALIMEVSSEASFSFGINWAIGGNTGDAAIVCGWTISGRSRTFCCLTCPFSFCPPA